jgi:hypothetical protein
VQVRGIAAPIEELQYIYENSRSIGVVVEKAELLKKLVTTGHGLTGDKVTAILCNDILQ